MRTRLLAALLLTFLFRAPGSADTVFLVNGRSFEGVIAEEVGDEVRIKMPGGSLSLPKSHVLRVQAEDSDFAEYMRRKEALRRNPQATAADWLALARWARAEGLTQGAREAALLAADLDPRAEGLAPILRGFGYALDEQLDRWVPTSDYMQRRGFVLSNGQWISREEHAAQTRAREEELARQRAEWAAARAAQANQAVREMELALAQRDLSDRLRREEAAPVPYYSYGVPVYVFPGFWPPLPPVPCVGCGAPGSGRPDGPDGEPPSHPHHRSTIPDGRNTFTHVPGSLIPGHLGPISKRD